MIARTLRIGVLALPAAAAALGQGTMTFFWTTDDTGDRDGVIEPGEAAVLTLWAGMEPGPPIGFASEAFSIAGDAELWQAGTIEQRENFIDSLGEIGWLRDDNSITGIVCFQLPPFFGDGYEDSNPAPLYEIRWRPGSYAPGTVRFWTFDHLNADVYLDRFGASESYDPEVVPGSMRIVPAPGAALLLGLARVAWRRRR
jgi:hypothetical protein